LACLHSSCTAFSPQAYWYLGTYSSQTTNYTWIGRNEIFPANLVVPAGTPAIAVTSKLSYKPKDTANTQGTAPFSHTAWGSVLLACDLGYNDLSQANTTVPRHVPGQFGSSPDQDQNDCDANAAFSQKVLWNEPLDISDDEASPAKSSPQPAVRHQPQGLPIGRSGSWSAALRCTRPYQLLWHVPIGYLQSRFQIVPRERPR
jgi:hypothetical protein